MEAARSESGRKGKKKHPDKEVQVWFQDEARYGQQGILTPLWAPSGSRPVVVRQNGRKCSYIIGAVDPVGGDHFGFCYTVLDTDVMNEFLKLLSRHVGCNVHVVLVIDNAGWHTSGELVVPKNITLLPLPPYSPELNPIERLWAYIKSNFLSLRQYADLDEVIRVGSEVWRNLGAEIIQSVCNTEWLNELYSD